MAGGWMTTSLWILILAYSCLVLRDITAVNPPVVFDEIYDGEHLKDVLFSLNSGETLRHAVLVLYTPDCRSQVNGWRRLHDQLKLPDDYYMFFAVHDYETAKKYTWYNWGPSENLTSWYNMTTECSHLFFLPRGSTSNTEPATLGDKSEFLTWIWDQVKVKVTLINDAQENVLFSFDGYHKNIPDVMLIPGQTKTVDAFTSYLLSATGDAGFYGGWTLGYNPRTLTVNVATQGMTQPRFFSEQHRTMNKIRARLDMDVWDYADRHLLNRKQPLVVKNFTESGYKKLLMPEWLKTKLVEYHQEQKPFTEAEQWEPGMTGINMENHRCGMVQLDNATKQVVASGIRPLLEEWCNCQLTMTAFYGIREYYKGHRLKNHVDRLGTHVISVILQITQDLDGGPDWELEVITFDGDRKHMTLKAGEMLFYESARLIHGRPAVFQGKLMANAFLHFKPTDWPYARHDDGKLYRDGQSLVSIYPLPDSKTLSSLGDKTHGLVDRVRDEL